MSELSCGTPSWAQRVAWCGGTLTRLDSEVSRRLPGGSVVDNLPADAGDMGSIPGPGGAHMLKGS